MSGTRPQVTPPTPLLVGDKSSRSVIVSSVQSVSVDVKQLYTFLSAYGNVEEINVLSENPTSVSVVFTTVESKGNAVRASLQKLHGWEHLQIAHPVNNNNTKKKESSHPGSKVKTRNGSDVARNGPQKPVPTSISSAASVLPPPLGPMLMHIPRPPFLGHGYPPMAPPPAFQPIGPPPTMHFLPPGAAALLTKSLATPNNLFRGFPPPTSTGATMAFYPGAVPPPPFGSHSVPGSAFPTGRGVPLVPSSANDNAQSNVHVGMAAAPPQLPHDSHVHTSRRDSHFRQYPTRILLSNDLVGAVIGRGGDKIKEISATTGARVEVKREFVPWSQYTGSAVRQNTGANEKLPTDFSEWSQIVFIFGNEEATSAAVRTILQIGLEEMSNCSRGQTGNNHLTLHLGLLVEDRFCGRIIGREGRCLTHLREETGATVFVNGAPFVTVNPSTASLGLMATERIVDIHGANVDVMCRAERAISTRVRQLVEQDHSRGNVSSAYPPAPTPTPAALSWLALLAGQDARLLANAYQNHTFPWRLKSAAGTENIGTLFMRIPRATAGAVIGSHGGTVKRIMEETGAVVTVSKEDKLPPTACNSPPDQPQQPRVSTAQRHIKIQGTAHSQMRAQWHIFYYVQASLQQSHGIKGPVDEADICLWTWLRVPRVAVGRLIGKAGRNLMNLQASTGTILHVPKPEVTNDTTEDNNMATDKLESGQIVEVFGTFQNTQLALGHIRAVVQQVMEGGIHVQHPQHAVFTSKKVNHSEKSSPGKSSTVEDPESSPLLTVSAEEDDNVGNREAISVEPNVSQEEEEEPVPQ